MRSLAASRCGPTVGVCWTARALTALLLWLIALLFIDVSIEEGGFHPLKVRGLDPAQMVFFWIACIGMVIGWRHEVIGGVVSVGGMVVVFVIEFALRSGTPGGLLLCLMFLPGILFVWNAVKNRS